MKMEDATVLNGRKDAGVWEDKWIPSACTICYGGCSILAHRVNGTIIKIEGNPKSPAGSGRLCAKGIAGIMILSDPHRVNTPLRRTNPEKGIGVDPGWKPVSWDEALDEIVERLDKVRAEDPRQLVLQVTTTLSPSSLLFFPFGWAFGTPNMWVAGGGVHCGNGAHAAGGVTHASWSIVPDFKHCNYAIYSGASKGHGAGHAATPNIALAADARERGMRMVVVDPMCNFAAGKANEWVPIRVGTDAALALAMANCLVNELGIYDADYLRDRTNAIYLTRPDGKYARDTQSGKPLIWDTQSASARPYDDPAARGAALEGEYAVDGVPCQPAFARLKAHLKQYTPARGEQITGTPAATIQRLAREFGEAARIGSTIVIDGVTLPYRPASAIFFRGAQGHKNSMYNCFAVDLLNHVVGAADVVGGTLGFNPVCYGHPESGRPYYVPRADRDGLMATGAWMLPHVPYPPADPRRPDSIGFTELFPLSHVSPLMASSDQEHWWRKFKLPYRPKFMLNYGANSVMSVGNKEAVAESLKNYDFIVSFDLFLNEFSDFADIILPDASYLEVLDPRPNLPFIFNHPAGQGEWGWPVRQPVAEPTHERRSARDVMLQLAYRLGLGAEINMAVNSYYGLDDVGKVREFVEEQIEGHDEIVVLQALCDSLLVTDAHHRVGAVVEHELRPVRQLELPPPVLLVRRGHEGRHVGEGEELGKPDGVRASRVCRRIRHVRQHPCPGRHESVAVRARYIVGAAALGVTVTDRVEAERAPHHVGGADDMIQQVDGEAVVHGVLMALRPAEKDRGGRPVGERHAVDHDGAADAGRFAEFTCQALDGRGGSSRDLLAAGGRVLFEVCLQAREGGLARHAVDRVFALQRRAARCRVIVRPGRCALRVPDQRLAGLRVAGVFAVGPGEIDRVGPVAQIVRIVNSQFVNQAVGHRQGQRGVGADADGDPFVGLARGEVAHRVDHHHAHAAFARVGGKRDVGCRRVARAMALGGAGVDRVVAVLEVGHDGPRRVSDPARGVRAVAAMNAAAGNPHVGRAERPAEGEEQKRGGGESRRHLEDQLARVLGAHLVEALDDLVQRFIPADRLPARVDADAFLGVGAPQRRIHAVRIVQNHDAGDAFGAQTAAAGRALGIAFDLDDGAIDPMREDRTTAVADGARGGNPFVLPHPRILAPVQHCCVFHFHDVPSASAGCRQKVNQDGGGRPGLRRRGQRRVQRAIVDDFPVDENPCAHLQPPRRARVAKDARAELVSVAALEFAQQFAQRGRAIEVQRQLSGSRDIRNHTHKIDLYVHGWWSLRQ